MKKILFILFFLLVIKLNAQPKLFFQGDYGVTIVSNADVGGTVSGSLFFKNGLAFSIGGDFMDFKIMNLPEGYHPGLCFYGDCVPNGEFKSFNLTAGKYFLFNDFCRMTLKAGIAQNNISTPVNFQPYESQSIFCLFCPSHTYQTEQHKNVGLLLKQEITALFSYGLGLTIGGYFNLNQYRNFGGAQIKLSFGYLREKTVKEQIKKMMRKKRKEKKRKSKQKNHIH